MMEDLTRFQRDLLYVIGSLDDDPRPHGLSIKNDIEEFYEVKVNHGRLYPNLDQLVEMSLVEKGTLDKRTNSYTLTDRGYETLETRREWERQLVDLDV